MFCRVAYSLSTCVDVCAAFAASFLIRIARLFPNELNLKKTAKDVEELAGILSEGKSHLWKPAWRTVS